MFVTVKHTSQLFQVQVKAEYQYQPINSHLTELILECNYINFYFLFPQRSNVILQVLVIKQNTTSNFQRKENVAQNVPLGIHYQSLQ